MNLNNPCCPQCWVEFSEKNIPLLLPDCGHSVCGNCISKCLCVGEAVICQEDNIISVNRTQLSDFPRNFALLQLITSQSPSIRKQLRTSSNSNKDIEIQLPRFQEQLYLEGSSSYNSDMNPSTTVTRQKMVENFVRRQIRSTKNISQDTLSETFSNETTDRCPVHRKKNEILCIQCEVKICSNCALFEGHKMHQVITVNDAIQKISKTVKNLDNICQKVEQARLDLKGDGLNLELKKHLNEHLSELMTKVDKIFNEIHDQVDQRRIKFEDQVRRKCNKMEAISLKHFSDLILDSSSKADLWCMSTQQKINYYNQQTQKGEMVIEILQEGGKYNEETLQFGQKVLSELQNTKLIVNHKVQEFGQKKLIIEYKGGMDRVLEGMLQINLRQDDEDLQNTQDQFNKSMSCKASQSNKESANSQYFMRMIVGDGGDPSLLKDINQSLLLVDPIADLPIAERFQEVINYQQPSTNTPKKVSFINNELTSRSYATVSSSHSVSQLRQIPRRVSVSPNSRRLNQNTKIQKISDKFLTLIQAMRDDQIESADFTGAGMGDELLKQLIPIITQSTNLRIIKLSRNNITDSVAMLLLQSIIAEQNKDQYQLPTNTITYVNLSNNMLTDKIVDFVQKQCYAFSNSYNLQSLRSIQMSLNMINAQRVKKKLLELKKLGMNIYI